MAQTQMPQGPDDSTGSAATAPADDDALRKRLLSRIAVAGVVIVGLLAGLAVYDSLNKPQMAVMPRMAAVPAEPEEKAKQEVIEEKPVEEKLAEEKTDAAAEKRVEEERLATTEPVPERSETPLAPAPVGKPLTPPATARQAAVKPSEPAAPTARSDARHEIVRAARRFLVQVGVFSNHANAEEMLQKLQAAGIPAQIESRVQVGPFASRAEVEVARAKLKALGIDDGMLVRR